METRVVHCKKEPYDVYIGRPSKWGNPFTHLKDSTRAEFRVETREEAIEAYRNWILNQPQLLQDLKELEGKTLGCWCKPKSCHGDILVELIKNYRTMKYVSIDIESTGLDPETCQILQVGAVIEDTLDLKPLEELPRFSCIVEHQLYQGQPFALNMNNWIIAILASLETARKEDREKIRKTNHIMGEGMVAKSLWIWLTANGIYPNHGSRTEQITVNVAGKNFASFDKKFLEKLPSWSNYIQFAQRIIDPAEFFTHWKEDERLPNLNECIRRAGLSGEVTHDAVQDAIDVIRVIRAATDNYEKRLYM